MFAYTFSAFTDRTYVLNYTDEAPTEARRATPTSAPFAFSGIYELPFGHGRRWGGNAGRVVNALVGGWTRHGDRVSSRADGRSASPIAAGTSISTATRTACRPATRATSTQPVFDLSGFYFADAAVQTNGVVDPVKQRNDHPHPPGQQRPLLPAPRRHPAQPGAERMADLARQATAITSRIRGQFNLELLNAFNQTIYAAPGTDPTNANFGKVTSQFNLPQSVQLAFKLQF